MISSDLVSIISVSIAVITITESTLTRFVRSRGKSYAAEMDFQRLRNDFDKMRGTLEIVEADIRKMDRDMVALRTMIQLRMNPAQHLDSQG